MTDHEIRFEIKVHNILLEQALKRRRQWLRLLTDTDREVERLQLSMRDLQEQLAEQSQAASDAIPSTPASPGSSTKMQPPLVLVEAMIGKEKKRLYAEIVDQQHTDPPQEQ